MIKKMTASDTNSVGKRGVPVRYRGGGGGGWLWGGGVGGGGVNPRYRRQQ